MCISVPLTKIQSPTTNSSIYVIIEWSHWIYGYDTATVTQIGTIMDTLGDLHIKIFDWFSSFQGYSKIKQLVWKFSNKVYSIKTTSKAKT